MAFINFEVRHDGTNVSDHVIRYQRNQQICTGIGTLDVTLENKNLNRTIIPWDTIVLYEEGTKIGTYIIATAVKSAESGTITLQCQDYSKKLIDNYITDSYSIPYLTTTKYWIEFFLNASDLDYEFTVAGDGEIVAMNSGFGMSSAYDLIVSFLQQSGWYIFFDANGKAIVGTTERAGDTYDDALGDSEVLSVGRMRNDNRLRNRAVVWGMGDPLTGSWIGADISRHTPWNYDDDDQRAIVLSNSMIYSTAVAEDLARKMLNEFAQIANEITVETVGHHDIELGDRVHVNSRHFSGRMMVTTIESEGSQNGLILRLTLNQRCPRLFAYFGYLSDYVPVYIGTWGQGVWKKYTGGTIWTQVSSGLFDQGLYIKDLFIKMGNLAAVTNDGYMYYSNIVTNIWTKFEHGDLFDLDGNYYPQINEENPELTTKAVACSIDDLGNIVVGYNYKDETIKRSWILTVSGTGVLLKAEQIILSTAQEVQLADLESVGYPEEGNILSVYGDMPSSFLSLSKRTTQYWGGIENLPSPYYSAPDKDTRVYGPPPGESVLGNYLTVSSNRRLSQVIVDEQGRLNFLTVNSNWTLGYIGEIDITNWTTKTYEFIVPTEWGATFAEHKQAHIHRIGNTFNIGFLMSGRADRKITYDIYTFNTAGMPLVAKGGREFQTDDPQYVPRFIGHACKESKFAFAFYWILGGSSGIKAKFVYGDLQSGSIGSDDFHISTYKFNIEMSGVHEMYYEQLSPFYEPDFIVNGDSIIFSISFQHTTWVYYDSSLFGDRHRCIRSIAKIQYSIITDSGGHTSRKSYGDAYQLYDWDYDVVPYTLSAGGGVNRWAWGGGGYRFTNTYIKKGYRASLGHMDGYPAHDPLWYKTYEIGVAWSSSGPSITVSDEIQTNDYTDSQYDPTGVFYFDYKPPNRWAWGNSNQDDFWTNVSNSNGSPVYGIPKLTDYPGGTLSLRLVNLMGLYSLGNVVSGVDYSLANLRTAAQADNLDNTLYYTGTSNGRLAILGITSSGMVIKRITGLPTTITHGFTIIGSYLIVYLTGGVRVYTIEPANTSGPAILKHTSVPITASGITISGVVASGATEQTAGIFEVISLPPNLTKVEISKGVPTTIYTPPWMSGDVQITIPNYIAASISNLANDFYFPTEFNYPPYDVRVFDVPSSGFTVASGILPTDMLLERYVGIAASGAVMMINFGFTGDWLQLVTMSGLLALASGIPYNPSGTINLLETTNYTLVPYMFVGISGPPPLFFQRTIYPYWVNASYTLPSSDLTVIRVDDDI